MGREFPQSIPQVYPQSGLYADLLVPNVISASIYSPAECG